MAKQQEKLRIPANTLAGQMIVKASLFATLPVCELRDELVTAVQADDQDKVDRVVGWLRSAMNVGTTKQWQAVGREKPANLVELRAAMVEAGYSMDVVKSLDWTPKEVAADAMAKFVSRGREGETKWGKAMSPAELARLFGRSERTIKRWLKHGKLRNRQIDSKNYLVDLRDLPTSKR